MSKVLRQHVNRTTTRLLRQDAKPVRIVYSPGEVPLVRFADGGEVTGVCLACPDVPCMEFSRSELIVNGLEQFPADQTVDVCAAGALSWDSIQNAPAVDNDSCIRCGICVLRCPVGAIGLDFDEGIQINSQPNDYFQSAEYAMDDGVVRLSVTNFNGCVREGILVKERDEISESLEAILQDALSKHGPQFPNHLTRNLLLANGIQAAMRRRGDVNLRMDLICGTSGNGRGVVEVELVGQSLLDSPRNVLDNVAVLANRYGVPIREIAALIVNAALPNARAEYWRVLKDISSVLGIRVGSLTIQALIFLVWNRASFQLSSNNLFYADEDNPTIRQAVERAIGRPLEISEGLAAALEVAK